VFFEWVDLYMYEVDGTERSVNLTVDSKVRAIRVCCRECGQSARGVHSLPKWAKRHYRTALGDPA
jgi:hypothetical protein